MEHLLGLASECHCYICGHTALRARNWIGFTCKRASKDTTLYRARSTEERRRVIRRIRRKKNDVFLLRAVRTLNCANITILYTHSIGNQP